MDATMELRVKLAEVAVASAKEWRPAAEAGGYAVGTNEYEVWRELARVALAKVGAVLEDAYNGGKEACDELRKRFRLGPMEEMPWDGVNELVGWDVVLEKEG